MIANRHASKCRVRIAHAALTFLATAALMSRHRYNGAAFLRKMKRVRGAHPTTVRILRCHSRPRLKHSRAGYSGNPYGTSLRDERASLEAGYSACAQWIPAFAGMTIGISRLTLFTGMPCARIQLVRRRLRYERPQRGESRSRRVERLSHGRLYFRLAASTEASRLGCCRWKRRT